MCRERSENFEENCRNPKKGWDEKFELFWKDVQSEAANLRTDPPELLRKRRASTRIEECIGENAAPEFYKDIISYNRKIYHEALDCITNVIVDQQDFKTYIKLENFLINAAKGDDFRAKYDDLLSIYIVRILMTIHFKYSWKHFQNIVKSCASFLFAQMQKF